MSPCPTCGCVLYQESGPCLGSAALARHDELLAAARALAEFKWTTGWPKGEEVERFNQLVSAVADLSTT